MTPAVIPAPKPTTSTERGCGCSSAERCPSMRSWRRSAGMVEASTLPAIWNWRYLAVDFGDGDRAGDALAQIKDLRKIGKLQEIAPIGDQLRRRSAARHRS